MTIKSAGSLKLSEIENEFDIYVDNQNIELSALGTDADVPAPYTFGEFYSLKNGPREIFSNFTITAGQKTHTLEWTVVRDDGDDPTGDVYIYAKEGDSVEISDENLLTPDGLDLSVSTYSHTGGYNKKWAYALVLRNLRGQLDSDVRVVDAVPMIPRFERDLEVFRDPTNSGTTAGYKTVAIRWDLEDQIDYPEGYSVEILFKPNNYQDFALIDTTISRDSALNGANPQVVNFPAGTANLNTTQQVTISGYEFELFVRYTVMIYLKWTNQEITVRGVLDYVGDLPEVPLLSAVPSTSSIELSWQHDSKSTRYDLYAHTLETNIIQNGTKIYTTTNAQTSFTHNTGYNKAYYYLLVASTQFASEQSAVKSASTITVTPSFEGAVGIKRDPSNTGTEAGLKTVRATFDLTNSIPFSEGYTIEAYYKANENQSFSQIDSSITPSNAINSNNPLSFNYPAGSSNLNAAKSITLTGFSFEVFTRYTVLLVLKWAGQEASTRGIVDYGGERPSIPFLTAIPSANSIQLTWNHDNKSTSYDIYYHTSEHNVVNSGARIYTASKDGAGNITTTYVHNIGYNKSGWYVVVARTTLASVESDARFAETTQISGGFETALNLKRDPNNQNTENAKRLVSVTFDLDNNVDYSAGYQALVYYKANDNQNYAQMDSTITADTAMNTGTPIIQNYPAGSSGLNNPKTITLTGVNFDLFVRYTVLVVIKWEDTEITAKGLIDHAGDQPSIPIVSTIGRSNNIEILWFHDNKSIRYEVYFSTLEISSATQGSLLTTITANSSGVMTTGHVHQIGYNSSGWYIVKAYTQFDSAESSARFGETQQTSASFDGGLTVNRDPNNLDTEAGERSVSIEFDLADGVDFSSGYTAEVYYRANDNQSFSQIDGNLTAANAANSSSPVTKNYSAGTAGLAGAQQIVLSGISFDLFVRYTILLKINFAGSSSSIRGLVDWAGDKPNKPMLSAIPRESSIQLSWAHDNKSIRYDLYFYSSQYNIVSAGTRIFTSSVDSSGSIATSYQHNTGYNESGYYALVASTKYATEESDARFAETLSVSGGFDAAIQVQRDPNNLNTNTGEQLVSVTFNLNDDVDYSSGYQVLVYYKANDNQNFSQIDNTITADSAANSSSPITKNYASGTSGLSSPQSVVLTGINFDLFTRYTILLVVKWSGTEITSKGLVDYAGDQPSIPIVSTVGHSNSIEVIWFHDNKSTKYEVFFSSNEFSISSQGTLVSTHTPNSSGAITTNFMHEIGYNQSGWYIVKASTQYDSRESSQKFGNTQETSVSFDGALVLQRDPNSLNTEAGKKQVGVQFDLADNIVFSNGYDAEVYYRANDNQDFAQTDSTLTESNAANANAPLQKNFPASLPNLNDAQLFVLSGVNFELFVRYTVLLKIIWEGKSSTLRGLIDYAGDQPSIPFVSTVSGESSIEVSWTHDGKSIRYEIYFSPSEFATASAGTLIHTSTPSGGSISTTYTHQIGYNKSGWYIVKAYTDFASKESSPKSAQTFSSTPTFENALVVRRDPNNLNTDSGNKLVSVSFDLSDDIPMTEGYSVKVYYKANDNQSFAQVDGTISKTTAANSASPITQNFSGSSSPTSSKTITLTGIQFELFTRYTLLVVLEWQGIETVQTGLIDFAGEVPNKPLMGFTIGSNTIQVSWTHDNKSIKYELYTHTSESNIVSNGTLLYTATANQSGNFITTHTHNIGYNKDAWYVVKAYTEFADIESDPKASSTSTNRPRLDGQISASRGSTETQVTISWDMMDDGPNYSEGYTVRIYYRKQEIGYVDSSMTWENSDNSGSPETFTKSGTGPQTVTLSKSFPLLERYTILMEMEWLGQGLVAPERVFLDYAGSVPSSPIISIFPTTSKGLKVTWAHDNKSTTYRVYGSPSSSLDITSTGTLLTTITSMTNTFEYLKTGFGYGEKYYFQVVATNSYGTAKSDVKGGTTNEPALAFGSGTLLDRSGNNQTDLTANWVVEPADLTGYTIDLEVDGTQLAVISPTTGAQTWVNALPEITYSYNVVMTLGWQDKRATFSRTIGSFIQQTIPKPTIEQVSDTFAVFTFSVPAAYIVTKWKYKVSSYSAGGSASFNDSSLWPEVEFASQSITLPDYQISEIRAIAHAGTYDGKNAASSDYGTLTVAKGIPDIASLPIVTSASTASSYLRVDTSTKGQVKIYIKFGTTIQGTIRQVSGWKIRQVVNSVVSDGVLASGTEPLSTEFLAFTHTSLDDETQYDYLLEAYWYRDIEKHRASKSFSAITSGGYGITFNLDSDITTAVMTDRSKINIVLQPAMYGTKENSTDKYNLNLYYRVKYTSSNGALSPTEFRQVLIGGNRTSPSIVYISAADLGFTNNYIPSSYRYTVEFYLEHSQLASITSPSFAPTSVHQKTVTDDGVGITLQRDFGLDGATHSSGYKYRERTSGRFDEYFLLSGVSSSFNLKDWNLSYTAIVDHPAWVNDSWGDAKRVMTVPKSSNRITYDSANKRFKVNVAPAMTEKVSSGHERAYNIHDEKTPIGYSIGEPRTAVPPRLSGTIKYTDGPAGKEGDEKTITIEGIGYGQPRYFPPFLNNNYSIIPNTTGSVYHRIKFAYSGYTDGGDGWGSYMIKQFRLPFSYSEFGHSLECWANWPFYIFKITGSSNDMYITHGLNRRSELRARVFSTSAVSTLSSDQGADLTQYLEDGASPSHNSVYLRPPNPIIGYVLLDMKPPEQMEPHESAAKFWIQGARSQPVFDNSDPLQIFPTITGLSELLLLKANSNSTDDHIEFHSRNLSTFTTSSNSGNVYTADLWDGKLVVSPYIQHADGSYTIYNQSSYTF